jgi:hypothetical protein
MSKRTKLSDGELFARYVGQPAELPEGVRTAARAALGNEPIALYAMADLAADLTFAETWIVLGETALAIVTASHVKRIQRANITAVSSEPGLSCRVLRLHGAADQGPLVELYFTLRQRRALDAIAFVLEQALDGRQVESRDADETYVNGVLNPVRDAQALVAPNKLAVVWRLLSYLAPYRARVVLGTSAAAAITGLSMAPPFITGHLVDRVIGPAQAGVYPLEAATRAATLCVIAIALVYVVRQLCVWVRLRLMAELGEWPGRAGAGGARWPSGPACRRARPWPPGAPGGPGPRPRTR